MAKIIFVLMITLIGCATPHKQYRELSRHNQQLENYYNAIKLLDEYRGDTLGVGYFHKSPRTLEGYNRWILRKSDSTITNGNY